MRLLQSRPPLKPLPRQVAQAMGRFVVAVLMGMGVCLCFFALHHLIEGIHPIDQWYYATLFAKIGASVGGLVGLFWATNCFAPRRAITTSIGWAIVGSVIFGIAALFERIPTLLILPTTPAWLTCSLLADGGSVSNGEIVIVGTVAQSFAYGLAGLVVSRLTTDSSDPEDASP